MRLIALIAALLLTGAAMAQEAVRIPINDGRDIEGRLYRPEGPGPFPAIVALHGCGGLFASGGKVSARHDDWGRRLAALGYVVVFPESYRSRGLGSQCVVKDRAIGLTRERVDDALAARRFLLDRLDVQPERISLLGWSSGGTSVLWAAAAERRAGDGKPDFRSAVAVYPGCRLTAQAAERREWEARLPLMILIGDADTWTPASACQQLAETARRNGGALDLVIYPGALHDFDHPNRPQTRRTGLAFTADNSGEALVGTDPAAREDAIARVPDFLAR
jgi:dienelactone hydrolase